MLKVTPTGIIFSLGLIVGFIIGIIITYQILFNQIIDHLPQLVTLKAMVHRPSTLVGLVINKALILCSLAYIPGLTFSLFLYKMIEQYTGIIMVFNGVRMGVILVLTLLMCLIGALLAVRTAVHVDPADLF